MHLESYRISNYTPGASLIKYIAWYLIGSPIVASSLIPFSGVRILILRLFGAKIGASVRIKPRVRIKFPWRLSIGDATWIGEGVWVDNIVDVTIGNNCCISQGAYFCTGNHDWSSETFDLIAKPIFIEDQVWVGANVCLGPGSVLQVGTVVALGSVFRGKTQTSWGIFSGNPAIKVADRIIHTDKK